MLKGEDMGGYRWHLHDGAEGMYQDPMGRRTPLRVIKVHSRMATVEWLAGGSTSRVSLRRITAPTYAEALTHWPELAKSMLAESPRFGIVNNDMPRVFNALKKAVEGKLSGDNRG